MFDMFVWSIFFHFGQLYLSVLLIRLVYHARGNECLFALPSWNNFDSRLKDMHALWYWHDCKLDWFNDLHSMCCSSCGSRLWYDGLCCVSIRHDLC